MYNITHLETPCYVFYPDRFNENLLCVKNAFEQKWNGKVIIGYSIKTNHSPDILNYSKQFGCMAEAVSNDEYELALSGGFAANQIIYNGPQKSGDTFLSALRGGSIINIDNFADIDFIRQNITQVHDATQIGIRANFDLESVCPGETMANNDVSRFGFCVENGEFEKAVNAIKALGLPVSGIHIHGGSRTRSLNVFRAIADMARQLIEQYSLHDSIKFIDVGGGFFGGQKLPQFPTMEEYADVITERLSGINDGNVSLIVEPGISILATAVDYVSRVINVRDIRDTYIATIDGSLLHINPFMVKREPRHTIKYQNDNNTAPKRQLVCGCTCMEHDRILELIDKNTLSVGDELWFHYIGAYTMTFNSCFINTPPNIYEEHNGQYRVLRKKNLEMMKYV